MLPKGKEARGNEGVRTLLKLVLVLRHPLRFENDFYSEESYPTKVGEYSKSSTTLCSPLFFVSTMPP
jgi:hypothetical protein